MMKMKMMTGKRMTKGNGMHVFAFLYFDVYAVFTWASLACIIPVYPYMILRILLHIQNL